MALRLNIPRSSSGIATMRACNRPLQAPPSAHGSSVLRRCAVRAACVSLAALVLLLGFMIAWRTQAARTPGKPSSYPQSVSDLTAFFGPRSSQDDR